nr:ribosomal protein L9 [Erythrotrichia longistipitata]
MTQKNISVLLLKNVDKLGHMGTISTVALGYARNFLIPQGLACVTTPGIQKAVKKELLKKQAIEEANINKSKELAQIIEGIKTFTIKKKVGKDDLIFGSVTNQDVAELLEETLKQSIEKKNITVPIIKKVGIYEASIKLHTNVIANIDLQVLAEEE